MHEGPNISKKGVYFPRCALYLSHTSSSLIVFHSLFMFRFCIPFLHQMSPLASAGAVSPFWGRFASLYSEEGGGAFLIDREVQLDLEVGTRTYS
jgi:hypothetical protein